MNNNYYRLVGVYAPVFIRPLYPDFIYPIFEKDNKYYVCFSKSDIKNSEEFKIDFFSMLNYDCNSIKFIDKDDIELVGKVDYQIGDDFVLALQLDKDKYIVGDIMEMGKFLLEYDPEYTILKNNLKGINNQEHLRQLNRNIKKYSDFYTRCSFNGKKHVRKL